MVKDNQKKARLKKENPDLMKKVEFKKGGEQCTILI